MKIVTLMENTSCSQDLRAEHGLSLSIEACGKRILFDAGQTDAFARNAEKLGIDLAAVDYAVLSHGHYDHGGGLGRFLEINEMAPVYINTNAFGLHYNAAGKYIGLDPALAESGRLILTGEKHSIAPGITLFSCNDLHRAYPTNPFGLTVKEGSAFRPEDFRHEQYLLVEENGKRVCFSGCSHKGVLNIVRWFRPDVLVGGFHFMKLNPLGVELRQAAEVLLGYPTTYYTGHCTGLAQFEAMKRIMGPRLHALSVGTVLEV